MPLMDVAVDQVDGQHEAVGQRDVPDRRRFEFENLLYFFKHLLLFG